MKISKLFLLACFFVLSNAALSQTSEEAARKIDSLFASYNEKTPGVAVAIVKDGKIVFKKGYGMADLDHDIPITPQTVFNLASVSKQFTAFAVYLLENEGKISFEDDVRKYIPELPNYGATIKIKHLLAHTSGLRDQWATLTLAGWRLDEIITTEQVLKLAVRQKSLNFTPGSAFGYCNTNFTLLAEIVHRVSGKTFAEYTSEKIFKPLGMSSTQFYDNHEKIVKNRAESYQLNKGVYYHKISNVTNVGPSNLLSTVEDLSKWALNFENPIVGNIKLIKAFNEASHLDNGQKVVMRIIDGDTIFQAKGQNLWKHKGISTLSHGGHTAAFRTYLGRFPDQHLSIIQLSNDEDNERLGGRWDIADFYIKDKLQERKGTNPVNATNASIKPTVNYITSIKEFEGEYHNDELITSYTFEMKGEKLMMKHIRLGDIELKRIGESKFSGFGEQTFSFEMEFLRNGTGAVTEFVISNFGVKNLKFARQK
jgi:CubicO group peptidase (beta-lactamase class C family)